MLEFIFRSFVYLGYFTCLFSSEDFCHSISVFQTLNTFRNIIRVSQISSDVWWSRNCWQWLQNVSSDDTISDGYVQLYCLHLLQFLMHANSEDSSSEDFKCECAFLQARFRRAGKIPSKHFTLKQLLIDVQRNDVASA